METKIKISVNTKKDKIIMDVRDSKVDKLSLRDNGIVVRKKDDITISVNTKKDTMIIDVGDRYFNKLSL